MPLTTAPDTGLPAVSRIVTVASTFRNLLFCVTTRRLMSATKIVLPPPPPVAVTVVNPPALTPTYTEACGSGWEQIYERFRREGRTRIALGACNWVVQRVSDFFRTVDGGADQIFGCVGHAAPSCAPAW